MKRNFWELLECLPIPLHQTFVGERSDSQSTYHKLLNAPDFEFMSHRLNQVPFLGTSRASTDPSTKDFCRQTV